MPRSVWKGPFVDGYLLQKAEKAAGRVHPTPRGLLKVRAPVSLGSAHLGRTVAAFLARFPEVKLELTLNDAFVDPAEQGATFDGHTPLLQPDVGGGEIAGA